MHQEVETEQNDLEPRPIIYIDKIVSDHTPDERYYNLLRVKFSDGSEEIHRNVDAVNMASLVNWMKNKTPLHRFEGGTLVEAPADIETHRAKLYDFAERVFEERCYSAARFADNNQTQLDHIDDERNGASDFVTYITRYLGGWYTNFPPHGPEDLERFRECMVKVANLTYSADGWAARRLYALDIEAKARAGAGSKVQLGEGN